MVNRCRCQARYWATMRRICCEKITATAVVMVRTQGLAVITTLLRSQCQRAPTRKRWTDQLKKSPRSSMRTRLLELLTKKTTFSVNSRSTSQPPSHLATRRLSLYSKGLAFIHRCYQATLPDALSSSPQMLESKNLMILRNSLKRSSKL